MSFVLIDEDEKDEFEVMNIDFTHHNSTVPYLFLDKKETNHIWLNIHFDKIFHGRYPHTRFKLGYIL